MEEVFTIVFTLVDDAYKSSLAISVTFAPARIPSQLSRTRK